jgi:ubiquinone/menaquinone biosynthesis C-methylase UbiE
MSQLTDRTYLLASQYRDPANLNARVRLHKRFSTNPLGWHQWVFQQLDLPERCRLLEVGCGPGYLWLENLDQIPPTWQILLSDFSVGMAAAAFAQLKVRGQFNFAALDIQDIALPNEYFDAVIANHMLYHVPDRERALAEIRRVLRPGGRIFTATNGRQHLLELRAIVSRFGIPEETGKQPTDAWEQVTRKFSLENGLDVLSTYFTEIMLRYYDDSLVVTEVEPIVSFVASSSIFRVDPDKMSTFREFLEAEIGANGSIRITKDSGLFSAIRL